MDGDGRTKADPAGVAGNAPNWLSERLELVNQPAPYVTGGSGDERTGHAQRGYARRRSAPRAALLPADCASTSGEGAVCRSSSLSMAMQKLRWRGRRRASAAGSTREQKGEELASPSETTSNRGWLTAHLRVRGAALAALLVAKKRARTTRLGPGAGVEAPRARACSASRRSRPGARPR